MLVLDPSKRYNTEQILNHKWTKMGELNAQFDEMIAEYDKVAITANGPSPINELIVQHMVSLGIERDLIVQVNCLLVD